MQDVNRAVLLAVLALVALLAGLGWFTQKALREPLKLPEDGYVLDVPVGSTLRTVSAQLAAEGVLAYPGILLAYAQLTGEAASIKAGEYEIGPGTTPLGLLRQLVEGQVRLHALTIVEGWSLRDLHRALRKHPAIRHTLATDDPQALSQALQLPSDHAEGWFFPDTYRFARGTTDRQILAMAHERMKTVLERAWAARRSDLPLGSPYEALILASIVEKETRLDRERPKIAGVFVRRLETGMRLQTDPTVIYGLGPDFDGDLTRRQLTRDTPYNTYTRSGLPPSPIAMPGESSILAAVHPEQTDALYFVASEEQDGSHVFSTTLREHNAAVRRYLAATKAEADK